MDVLNISQPDQICENFCIPYAIWTGQWMDVLLGDFVTQKHLLRLWGPIDLVLDQLNGLGTSWKCWIDATLKIIIGLFGSIRWFCDSKAHLMNLGTSWLGWGPVEWVRGGKVGGIAKTCRENVILFYSTLSNGHSNMYISVEITFTL